MPAAIIVDRININDRNVNRVPVINRSNKSKYLKVGRNDRKVCRRWTRLSLNGMGVAAMQEAVWSAVQGCQYDDPMKKERLCSAVMEALSGTKTMKAAAATHEVGDDK
jgi:hypothetical protein